MQIIQQKFFIFSGFWAISQDNTIKGSREAAFD